MEAEERGKKETVQFICFVKLCIEPMGMTTYLWRNEGKQRTILGFNFLLNQHENPSSF